MITPLSRTLRGSWKAMTQQTCALWWNAPCTKRSCAGLPRGRGPQVHSCAFDAQEQL